MTTEEVRSQWARVPKGFKDNFLRVLEGPQPSVTDIGMRMDVLDGDLMMSPHFLDYIRSRGEVIISYDSTLRAVNEVFSGKSDIRQYDFLNELTELLDKGDFISNDVKAKFNPEPPTAQYHFGGAGLVALASTLGHLAFLEGRIIVEPRAPYARSHFNARYSLHEPTKPFPKELLGARQFYDWLKVTDR